MSETMAPWGSETRPDDPADSDRQRGRGGAGHAPSVRHWLRHFAEMVIAMMIGMQVGVKLFQAIVGVSYRQSVRRYPTAALVVMAVSMTAPMVAWMRFRRHTWRNSMEMGAAMLLPALPFLVCVWAHVVDKAPNGPYMAVSALAMVVLMLYRWDVYATHPMRPLRAPSATASPSRT